MARFNKHDIQGEVIATTYGDGPFHPAFRIRATGVLYYWPNITHPNEEDAVASARESIRGNIMKDVTTIYIELHGTTYAVKIEGQLSKMAAGWIWDAIAKRAEQWKDVAALKSARP